MLQLTQVFTGGHRLRRTGKEIFQCSTIIKQGSDMKKIILVLFLLSMTSILAQDLESYTKLLQSNISADKVNIITFNMMFTEKESEKFWPIYS